MQQAKILLKLQEYLQRKQDLKKDVQLTSLANELKILKTTISKAEQESIELDVLAKNKEEKAREVELQVAKTAEQAKSSKERLYNAKGSGLKELLGLQQSIQILEEDIETGEAGYWKLINEAEEFRNKRTKDKEIIKALKAQYNEGVREYNRLRKNLELQLAENQLHEEETISQLNKEYLDAYKQMERKFPLNPVAVLKGDTCSCCNLSISALLKKDLKEDQKVCYCENCGRILVK